jgi:Glycine zipper
MHSKLPIAALLAMTLALSACADMSPGQQRVMTGTAGGAAGGALIGAMAGNAGLGALIGAGTGAVGGFAFDQHMQARQRSFDQGVAVGRGWR